MATPIRCVRYSDTCLETLHIYCKCNHYNRNKNNNLYIFSIFSHKEMLGVSVVFLIFLRNFASVYGK